MMHFRIPYLMSENTKQVVYPMGMKPKQNMMIRNMTKKWMRLTYKTYQKLITCLIRQGVA